MQVSQNRNWGVWGLAKHIVQTEGARGLFRGYVLTQAVYVPYTVVYFVSYERFKTAWAGIRGYMGTMDYLLCSTASASLAGAVSNVLDVVKTRVQVDSRPAFAVIADMYRKDGGLMAFSRGMGARILWVAPSMAISITVYETLKDIRQARISKAK